MIAFLSFIYFLLDFKKEKKNFYLSLPELHQNPLVQRVIEIFDQDGNGEVDFKEFIEGVSQFSVKGDKDSKLKCKIIPKNQFVVYTINYAIWY